MAARAADFDSSQWGLLAVQDNGRRKPMDTFAKETLTRLTGKDSFKTAEHEWSASEFVLSILLGTHEWKQEQLILVGYKPLIEQLKLDKARKRFSFDELAANESLKTLAGEAHEAKRAGGELSRSQKEIETLSTQMNLFVRVADGSAFLIVPPPANPNDRWMLPTEAEGKYDDIETFQNHLRALAGAYLGHNEFELSLNASRLRTDLRRLSPAIYPSESALKLEYFYNHIGPFDWALWLYVGALLVLGIPYNAPRSAPRGLMTAGLFAAFSGLVCHAGGILLRCLIAARPPVTNMYESVIWVSFGVMAFAWIFYFRYRGVVYLLAALPVSIVCLFVVHQLPIAMPASIDPLVPVLRSNFWLTIHVLTITLSYAAFALAMGFAHIVLFQYVKSGHDPRDRAVIHFWLYRIIQLGVLLLAAGTILGGVWANYSWGRFWGWDPKETWALIALLCYIFVLHGRLTGWWDQFGLAVASIICFCAVMMTWYGVNFVLGKGLHSYGFGIGGEGYVAAFVVLDLTYVAVAAIRSRKARAAEALAMAETEELVEDV